MKNKLLVSITAATAIALLSGCGSSSGSASGGSEDNSQNAKQVTVERGAVIDAVVTDASGQRATSSGTNVYTFANAITYPVKVLNGWIDVDGDGQMTTSDIRNTSIMRSNTNIVTPITSYLESTSNEVSTINSMMEEYGLTKEELQSLPSKSTNKDVTLLNNAIYETLKKTYSEEYTDMASINTVKTSIKANFDNLISLKTTFSAANPKQFAVNVENQVINTNLVGFQITKLTQSYIDSFQSSNTNSNIENNTSAGSSETNSTDTFTVDDIHTTNVMILKNISSAAYDRKLVENDLSYRYDLKYTESNTTASCEELGYTLERFYDSPGSSYTLGVYFASGVQDLYNSSTGRATCTEKDLKEGHQNLTYKYTYKESE